MRTIKEDTVVYVQPRFGFAWISLTWLCKKYGKKLVLFMPSSKEVSEHQAYCIENWASVRFHRIAAMPNLNRLAHVEAEKNWWYFIPLGLKHHLVTAMIVKTCQDLIDSWITPKRIWCATSTWVLSRGLQIGFPEAEVINVAVARNIKEWEKGRATILSYYCPFSTSVEHKVYSPFESCNNYDLKCWDLMQKIWKEWDFMWNVAGNIKPSDCFDKNTVKSERKWGE